MANWCYTRAVVYGPLKEVMLMRRFILKAMAAAPQRDHVDDPHNWLGQQVVAAGGSALNCYCRGWIQEVSEMETNASGESHFFIESEDAWSPHLPDVLQYIIDNKFPDSKLAVDYTAEENGCLIFINTDTSGTFFSQRYIVLCEEGDDTFDTEEELLEFVNDCYQKDFKSFAEAHEWAEGQEYLGIYEYEEA